MKISVTQGLVLIDISNSSFSSPIVSAKNTNNTLTDWDKANVATSHEAKNLRELSVKSIPISCNPGTLVVSPNDTICTGGTATFSVTGTTPYDSIYYFINNVFQIKEGPSQSFTPTSINDNDVVSALIFTGVCVDVTNNITMRVLSVSPNAGQDQIVCASSSGSTLVTLAGSAPGGGTWTSTSGASGTFSPNATTLNATYTPSAIELAISPIILRLTSKICPTRTDDVKLSFLQPPAAPVISVSNITSSGMRFSWPAVAGATTYSVSVNGGALTNIGNALLYDVTGQAAGTTVTISVKGLNATCPGAAGTRSATTLAATAGACDTNWTVSGAPFCIASLKSKLRPTVTGGVFTGTGVVLSGSEYYFDPSVSGPGTFSVTYTMSCGKSLTKSIVVNDAPCVAPITPSDPSGVTLISQPQGIATDCDGTVYFSDTENNAIWKINSAGVASLFMGDTNVAGDGLGVLATPASVRLNGPTGIIAYYGDLYFADTRNQKIKKYDKATNTVLLVAGSSIGDIPLAAGPSVPGASAKFNSPTGLTINVTGTALYVADRLNYKVKMVDLTTPAYTVSYLAGTTNGAIVDGAATTSRFRRITHLAIYGNNLYIADPDNFAIRDLNLTTNIVSTTYLGASSGDQPYGLSVDCSGKVYYADANNNAIKSVVNATTASTLLGAPTYSLNFPTALSLYNKGYVDIADTYNNAILRYAISNWKSGAFNGLDTTHCLTDAPDVLSPITCAVAGGYSYSGNGIQVSGSIYSFAPAVAGIGRHKITYKYTAGYCQDSLITYANVSQPVADAGADSTYCGPVKNKKIGGIAAVAGNTYSWTSSPSVGAIPAVARPTIATISSTTTFTLTVTDINGCTKTDAVIKKINALPVMSLGLDDSICAPYNPGVDSMYVGPASVAGTTYQWSSSPAPSITNTSTPAYVVMPSVNTTYYLTATITSTGCIKKDTLNIKVNPLPVPDLGTYPSIACRGSKIQLGNPGDYVNFSYNWGTNNPPFGGGGYNNPSLANPIYTLYDTLGIQFQLTKTNKITGCSNQDIGGTVVRASPKANFTTSGVCYPSSITFADSSSITGVVTDVNDALNSWKWNFGDPGASPALSDTSDLQNPLPYNYSGPGVYNVKLVVKTGNNCMDSITKPININSLTVAFTGPTKVCSGNSVSLTNTSTSNPAGTLNCVWNFGDGSPNVNTTNLTSPGTHTFPVLTTVQTYNVTLTVTATNGCSDTYTQAITVYPIPDATIMSSSTSACFGNNITLDVNASYTSATPYKVIWKNLSTNTVLSTSPQTTLVVSTNGIYRATVVDTVGGCADSSSVNLNFLNPPTNLAMVAPATTCSNAPLKLISTVSGGDSLQFKWITSNGTGSFSNSVNDTTFYTPGITDPSPLTFTVSAYNRCDSLSATQSVSVLASASGSFTFTPTEPFMNDLITFVPDTGTGGNNITKWFWDFKEGNAIDSVSYIGAHAFLHGGSFPVTLTLINIQGCSTQVVNFVDIAGPVIYIPNVFEPSTVNPENSVCKVYGSSIAPDEFSFKIFDKWGSVVYQTSDFIQANQTGWNGKNLSGGDPLPMGVYTYAVKGHFYDGSSFEKAGTVTLIR